VLPAAFKSAPVYSMALSAAVHAGLLLAAAVSPVAPAATGARLRVPRGEPTVRLSLVYTSELARPPTPDAADMDPPAPLAPPEVPVVDVEAATELVRVEVGRAPTGPAPASVRLPPVRAGRRPQVSLLPAPESPPARPASAAGTVYHTLRPAPVAPDVRAPAVARTGSTAPEGPDPSARRPAGGAASRRPGLPAGAELLRMPEPVYPPSSIRRGEQGRVVLSVEVRPDGRAGQIAVRRSSGHARLDRAAVEAVRHARFDPATRDGRAVASWIDVPVRFVLQE